MEVCVTEIGIGGLEWSTLAIRRVSVVVRVQRHGENCGKRREA